ncbi:MAG: hypothetical protein WKH64_18210 [Chloroflexia bacterium]
MRPNGDAKLSLPGQDDTQRMRATSKTSRRVLLRRAAGAAAAGVAAGVMIERGANTATAHHTNPIEHLRGSSSSFDPAVVGENTAGGNGIVGYATTSIYSGVVGLNLGGGYGVTGTTSSDLPEGTPGNPSAGVSRSTGGPWRGRHGVNQTGPGCTAKGKRVCSGWATSALWASRTAPEAGVCKATSQWLRAVW